MKFSNVMINIKKKQCKVNSACVLLIAESTLEDDFGRLE